MGPSRRLWYFVFCGTRALLNSVSHVPPWQYPPCPKHRRQRARHGLQSSTHGWCVHVRLLVKLHAATPRKPSSFRFFFLFFLLGFFLIFRVLKIGKRLALRHDPVQVRGSGELDILDRSWSKKKKLIGEQSISPLLCQVFLDRYCMSYPRALVHAEPDAE